MPFVILYRPGPAWKRGQPVYAQNLEGHGRWVQAAFDRGEVVFGGPCRDDPGGLTVVDMERAAAEAFVRDDPAVASGVFEATLHALHVVFNRYTGADLTSGRPPL